MHRGPLKLQQVMLVYTSRDGDLCACAWVQIGATRYARMMTPSTLNGYTVNVYARARSTVDNAKDARRLRGFARGFILA